MNRKKLDTSNIVNELQGASIFFQKPPPANPVPGSAHPDQGTERNTERTEVRTENRSYPPPIAFPHRRRTTRYSFEFYEDQILRLKNLKHHAEMNGSKLTLSDLAREAIDLYLKDRDQ